MQEHLYKHFESEGHTEFPDDVSTKFIDKIDRSNPIKTDSYRMQTLKTFAPYGLNIGDSN